MKALTEDMTMAEALIHPDDRVRTAAQAKFCWYNNTRPSKKPDDLLTRVYSWKLTSSLDHITRSIHTPEAILDLIPDTHRPTPEQPSIFQLTASK